MLPFAKFNGVAECFGGVNCLHVVGEEVVIGGLQALPTEGHFLESTRP